MIKIIIILIIIFLVFLAELILLQFLLLIEAKIKYLKVKIKCVHIKNISHSQGNEQLSN